MYIPNGPIVSTTKEDLKKKKGKCILRCDNFDGGNHLYNIKITTFELIKLKVYSYEDI